MRAVLYCRVSTTEQAQNLSLDTQEAACRAYCAREGYAVDRLFVDAGESAKTANRPAFQDLLTYCRVEKGKVHAVIVYSLTRFSRNNADHHAIAALLRGFGVMLRSVTEPIDESPSGKLMEAILAGVAQFDNDVRADRTIAGMKTAMNRGRWVWGAPLGYRNTHARHQGPSLEPDVVMAPHVRRAFTLVADGRLAGQSLRDRLTKIGLRGRAGAPITSGRLYSLLRNTVYIGRIEKWGTSVVGDFEPLVTEAIFREAQRQLDARNPVRPHAHRNHPDFPLRRFVRCAVCTKGLTGSWSRGRSARYAHYHCVAGCTRIAKQALEDAFLQLVDRLTPTARYLAVMREVTLDIWQRRHVDARQLRATMLGQLTLLDGQLQALEHAYVFERRIDANTYQRLRDELREKMTLMEIDLRETQMEAADLEALVDFAAHALSHASAIWTSASSTDERMRIQATLFPEGVTWAPPLPTRRRRLAARSRATVGTAIADGFLEPRSCLAFYQLDGMLTDASRVVAHAGPTWNQVLACLLAIRAGFPAAA